MDELDSSKKISQEDDKNAELIGADEYATLIKNCKGFNIFFVEDQYYALTADYGEVISRKVARDRQSLTSSSLLELEDAIDEAIAFSNSRGNFDSRFRQKVKGALMKAESVHDNKFSDGRISPALPSGKVVYVKELDSYFFVTPDELPQESLNNLDSTVVNAYYASAQAELIATFGDYNLVSFDTKLFAVKQGIPVDDIDWRSGAIADKLGVRQFSNTKDAIAYIKLQLKVEGSVSSGDSLSAAPILLETDLDRAINYVFYSGLYYAIPHSLGEINLQELISELPQGVIFSDSLDSLKSFSGQQAIASPNPSQMIASGSSDIPQFLRAEGEYNIIFFGGYYFAIPQSLGNIDLLETDFMNVPEIVRDVSLYVIEDYIAEKMRQSGKVSAPAPASDQKSALQHSRDAIVRQQEQLQKAIAIIREQKAELEEAKATIAGMESSKFWKLRKRWFRLKTLLKKIKARLQPSKS